MRVAVLDYAAGEVAVYEAPNMETNEEVMEWLEDKKGHRIEDCYFMTGDFDINIDIIGK